LYADNADSLSRIRWKRRIWATN